MMSPIEDNSKDSLPVDYLKGKLSSTFKRTRPSSILQVSKRSSST